MSKRLIVSGPSRLSGEVRVGGAKNAALPMLIASLLTPGKVRYSNVPAISDIKIVTDLLEDIGSVIRKTDDYLEISTPEINNHQPSPSLVKACRASFWVLAPILARLGKAEVFLPGGDIIGSRPVDIHLEGLKAMGAEIKFENSLVTATAPKGLKSCDFTLSFASVGATHQLLLAASLIEGTTTLRNVAREPEIVALAELLVSLGAKIQGAGTSEIQITGCKELGNAETAIIGDRIEAATYILAAIATGGEVLVDGFNPKHLGGLLDILTEMGVNFQMRGKSLSVKAPKELKPVNVATAPFPGFASDIQPQLMAVLALANGQSEITETIYESRFAHIASLNKLAATISADGATAKILGKDNTYLSGKVMGHDIRAAAAVLIAALTAEGETEIYDAEHLERGYSGLIEKMTSLGAKLQIVSEDFSEDSASTYRNIEVAIGC